MIIHHPGEELLIAYAAGASDEAVSLIVATHWALCPDCRRELHNAAQAGGTLLDDLPPMPFSDSALNSVMSPLKRHGSKARAQAGTAQRAQGARAVAVLSRRRSRFGALDSGGARVGVPPDLQEARQQAQLIRSKPGHGVSLHSHRGEEYSLVPTGSYTDRTGHYRRGDVQTGTPDLLHHSLADEREDCIVLGVADAPLNFRNPFVGLMAKVMGY